MKGLPNDTRSRNHDHRFSSQVCKSFNYFVISSCCPWRMFMVNTWQAYTKTIWTSSQLHFMIPASLSSINKFLSSRAIHRSPYWGRIWALLNKEAEGRNSRGRYLLARLSPALAPAQLALWVGPWMTFVCSRKYSRGRSRWLTLPGRERSRSWALEDQKQSRI